MKKVGVLLFLVLVLLTDLITGSAVTGDGTKIKVEKSPTVERRWQHWGNKVGEFDGTFERIEGGNTAVVRDPHGKELHIPLFYFSAPDLSYMLNRLAQFPEYVSVKKDAGEKNLLVNLDASGLPAGDLTTWKNTGVLGGAFHSMNVPPVVKEIDGRKGVLFDYNFFYIDPTYNAMTADVLAPETIADGKDFTLAAWIYRPRDSGAGTLLSWQAMGGDFGTCVSPSSGEQFVPGLGSFTMPANGSEGEWQHVAYVFTGGGRTGEYRAYVNGIQTDVKHYDYIAERLPPTDITTTSVTLNANLFLNGMDEARVVAYIGTHDHHMWFQARHWKWDDQIDIGLCKEGPVSVTFKNLMPGTNYFYRFLVVDKDCDNYWAYPYAGRRWDNGPGRFRTAGEDGTPGRVLPEDDRRHLFLGINWGSRWYMAYPGPSSWFRGCIGGLKLFDYALNELELRNLIGKRGAFDPCPANDARLDKLETNLTWRAGLAEAGKYRVYCGIDRQKVTTGDDDVLLAETEAAQTQIVPLLPGARYFWRVEQLDRSGSVLTPGEIWEFNVMAGEARDPFPEDGRTLNPVGQFSWQPGRYDLKEQRLYLAECPEELVAMEKPTAVLKSKVSFQVVSPMDNWRTDTLVHGRTYYWRIESVQDDGRITPGITWSFTTADYFTPEFDGRVAEPYPLGLQPGRAGAKIIDGNGHPSITSPGADEALVRLITQATDRYLEKDFGLVRMFASIPCGTIVNSFEGGGWARGYACGSYGGVEGARSSDFLLLHEMGHQIFMNGLMHEYPDFYKLETKVFQDHAVNNAWLGDYAANNPHEMMAVSCQQFMSTLGRERMFKSDNPMYHLLKAHLAGQVYVDLDPARGLQSDAAGKVVAWDNAGGLEEWAPYGYVTVPGTVGTFTPVGSPDYTTVDGVSAVTFDGSDALVWDCVLGHGMGANRTFSVELWAWSKLDTDTPGTLVSWGMPGKDIRLLLDGSDTAYANCGSMIGNWKNSTKPAPGKWHHIVHVFVGGVGTNPGAYRVFVDGRLVSETNYAFAVTPGTAIQVGGIVKNGTVTDGFRGAIARLRVHNYDLGTEQVADLYQRQAPAYHLDPLQVAGTLYVNCDSRVTAPPGDDECFPLYPESLHKPWLRSWVNLGTLAGSVHNDLGGGAWGPSGSTPIWKQTGGVRAPHFTGKDRMVALFEPSARMIAEPPGTLELWVYNSANTNDACVLQWGDFRLDAKYLLPGWQHVGVLFRPGEKGTLYINGKELAELPADLNPVDYQKLHLGAWFDYDRWSWRDYFNGVIAAVRVHAGRLIPEQLALNARTYYCAKAHAPQPADGSFTVARRSPVLRWSPGVTGEPTKEELFIGLNPDALKKIGVHAPGTCTPVLQPGTTYYWRAGKDGDLWSFTTRKEALVDLSAASLPEGRLAEWPNAGAEKESFVPGARRNLSIAAIDFNGTVGLDLIAGATIEATFEPLDCLKKGPFSMYLHAVSPERLGAGQVVGWGTEQTPVSFRMGVRNRGNVALAVGKDASGRTFEWPGYNAVMGYIWKKIVLTYDGTEMKLYLDGREIAAEEMAYSLEDAGKLVLGHVRNNNSRTILNDLRVFSKALGPDEIAVLTEGETVAEDALVVAVSLNEFANDDAVKELPNRGSAGGTFIVGRDVNHAPDVKMVDGRKGVYFAGSTEFMQSTFGTPPELSQDHPFTVEMIVNSEDTGNGIAFAVAPRVAMEGNPGAWVRRDLGLSFSGKPGRQQAVIRAGRDRSFWNIPGGRDYSRIWTHVAWVYDGGRRSKLKLYVNGILVNQQEYYTLNTIGGHPMCLGGTFQRELGEQDLFKGTIASVKAYDYARSDEEIAAAAEPFKKIKNN